MFDDPKKTAKIAKDIIVNPPTGGGAWKYEKSEAGAHLIKVLDNWELGEKGALAIENVDGQDMNSLRHDVVWSIKAHVGEDVFPEANLQVGELDTGNVALIIKDVTPSQIRSFEKKFHNYGLKVGDKPIDIVR